MLIISSISAKYNHVYGLVRRSVHLVNVHRMRLALAIVIAIVTVIVIPQHILTLMLACVRASIRYRLLTFANISISMNDMINTDA